MLYITPRVYVDIIRTSKGLSPKDSIPLVYTTFFGGFAGFVSVIGNTPIDVVKTRMQVTLLATELYLSSKRNNSLATEMFLGS